MAKEARVTERKGIDMANITVPNLKAIHEEFSPVVARAEVLEVAGIEQHEGALMLLKDIRTGRKSIKERIDPIVSQANKLHKSLTGLRKDAIGPLDRAEAITIGKLDLYEKDQKLLAEAVSKNSPFEIEPEIAHVEGISSRTIWKAEVMDIVLALQHMTRMYGDYPEKTWDKLAKVLESELGPLVRAQQSAFRMPGVRAVAETSRSVRTA